MSTPRVNLLSRKVVAPPLPTPEQFSAFLTLTLIGGLALWCASAVILGIAVRTQTPWLALPCLLCNLGAFVFVAHRLDGHAARVSAALDGLKLHELVRLVGRRRSTGVGIGQILRAIDRQHP